ncbi:hypothetical protein F2Q68_00041458 [Brassica cretica]|uniref:Uncharacterized protein n=1 Tax=Brassica cretica TaxID=69181 RepID=A0A8S9MS85_BRACR|nr:hypothetical protein F2Q68_00041458 [Brassica cretica]
MSGVAIGVHVLLRFMQLVCGFCMVFGGPCLRVLLLSVGGGASVAWVQPLSCSGKFCRWFSVTDVCGAKILWISQPGSVVWRFSTSSFSPNKSFVLERTLSAALKLWTGDYSIGFMFVALLMVNRCRIEAAI